MEKTIRIQSEHNPDSNDSLTNGQTCYTLAARIFEWIQWAGCVWIPFPFNLFLGGLRPLWLLSPLEWCCFQWIWMNWKWKKIETKPQLVLTDRTSPTQPVTDAILNTCWHWSRKKSRNYQYASQETRVACHHLSMFALALGNHFHWGHDPPWWQKHSTGTSFGETIECHTAKCFATSCNDCQFNHGCLIIFEKITAWTIPSLVVIWRTDSRLAVEAECMPGQQFQGIPLQRSAWTGEPATVWKRRLGTLITVNDDDNDNNNNYYYSNNKMV